MKKIIFVFLYLTLFYNNFYAQSAKEYLVRGLELEKKANSSKLEKDSNKNEILSEALRNYELSIKTDSNYFCAYWVAYNLLSSNDYFSDEEKELRLLNKIADSLITSEHKIDNCFTAREVFVNIAILYVLKYYDNEFNEYEGYLNDNIDFLNLSIRNFMFALNYENLLDGRYGEHIIAGYSNQDIYNFILDANNNIIEIYKNKNDYFLTKKYLENAISYANKCPDCDYTAEEFILQKNILSTLRRNKNWAKLFITDSSNELITNDNYLFVYKKDEMVISNNIVRIWLMTIYVGDLVKFDSTKYFESKQLTEFDLTQKKGRTLSEIYYDINSHVLFNKTYDNPEWDYIIPDTIFENIFNYLKQTTKNKKGK